jgi:hypothetical protein
MQLVTYKPWELRERERGREERERGLWHSWFSISGVREGAQRCTYLLNQVSSLHTVFACPFCARHCISCWRFDCEQDRKPASWPSWNPQSYSEAVEALATGTHMPNADMDEQRWYHAESDIWAIAQIHSSWKEKRSNSVVGSSQWQHKQGLDLVWVNSEDFL